jgi:hypothetical protein
MKTYTRKSERGPKQAVGNLCQFAGRLFGSELAKCGASLRSSTCHGGSWLFARHTSIIRRLHHAPGRRPSSEPL